MLQQVDVLVSGEPGLLLQDGNLMYSRTGWPSALWCVVTPVVVMMQRSCRFKNPNHTPYLSGLCYFHHLKKANNIVLFFWKGWDNACRYSIYHAGKKKQKKKGELLSERDRLFFFLYCVVGTELWSRLTVVRLCREPTCFKSYLHLISSQRNSESFFSFLFFF